MPAPEKGLVITGARAQLLFNGIKIGWATQVSGSERIMYERIKVLDNIQTQEHVPVDYEVTLSAARVRIAGKTLKSQGFFPSVGANAEEHLSNILTSGDLVISINDTGGGTSKPIATYEQCKTDSHNWTITATGVMANDMTFVGIRAKDESEV